MSGWWSAALWLLLAAGPGVVRAGEGGSEVLSLDRCIEIAIEKSPAYGQAEERLYSSRSRVGLARSGLLPQLSLSSNMLQYGDERPTGVARPASSVHGYDAALSIRQSLIDVARWSNVTAARHRREGAEAGLRDARLNAVLRVKENYLTLLRSQHLLTVAGETLEASRHRQERVDALHEVGSVAKADVLQNKVQLAEDELKVISARNQVEIARASLLNAMGLDTGQEIQVAEVTERERGGVPSLESLFPEAHEHNAGLADLHQEVRASREELAAARGGHYPSLDMSWNYGWNNYRLPRSGSEFSENADWTAALTLRYNLFDGLATRSSVTASRHNYEQTRLREEQAKLDLSLEVRRQHSSLMEADERIRVAGESVTFAEERVRLEEERYRLGAATLLEFIEAQVALTRARTSEVEARYDYSLAWARLERAVGRP